MNGFKWDVFLSYHNEMEDFVLTHIKMPLEHRQPSYNVCWHHVDFLAGRTILDNINKAVDESRKVVFVFSKSFPQSEYCMAELTRTLDRLQRTRTRCMVPIVLTEEGVPKELKSRVTYWPVVKPEADFIVKLISHLGKLGRYLQASECSLSKQEIYKNSALVHVINYTQLQFHK